jgi:hypothetical protein
MSVNGAGMQRGGGEAYVFVQVRAYAIPANVVS